MIRIKIFQKHFLIVIGTIAVFLILGFFINDQIMQTVMRPPGQPPPVFFAKLVDQYDSGTRQQNFERIYKVLSQDERSKITLLDANGEFLAGSPLDKTIDWESIQKPEESFQFKSINSNGRPTPGAPLLIKFPPKPQESKTQYLYAEFGPGHAKFLPFLTLASLVICLLLGIGTAMYLIYRSIAETVESADFVISELQKGNLKARFKINKSDEIGKAMQRFNKMADEIEHLVEQMKAVEKSRVTLLQELAHDLRTPMASLKNILETFQRKESSMSPQIKQEMMQLSLKEVDYFEHLVEDLLFLAQVSDPHYHADIQSVQIAELVENTIRDIETIGHYPNVKIRFEKNAAVDHLQILGDTHLLHRLFRNGLENAVSFARSSVVVHMNAVANKGYCEFLIQDDGIGFTAESLLSFGERRVSRKYNKSENARVSVGLGSVIMKTVSWNHRGNLSAKNRLSDEGHVLGAEIRIELPIETAPFGFAF